MMKALHLYALSATLGLMLITPSASADNTVPAQTQQPLQGQVIQVPQTQPGQQPVIVVVPAAPAAPQPAPVELRRRWAEREPHFIGFRFTPAFGGWWGNYNQNFGSQSVHVPNNGSFGMEFPFGFRVGPIFAEYNILWFTPSYYYSVFSLSDNGPHSAGNNDASYASIFGGNLGVILPFFRYAEVFLGLEDGSYTLFNSPLGGMGGTTAKFGFNLVYKYGPMNVGVGLRFEYRKTYISSDSSGSLPSGVSTNADSFFLGLTTGLF